MGSPGLDLDPRRLSLHALALAAVVVWSFHERSEPKVTPSIEILSLNPRELESNDMVGRFLSTRRAIRQPCVFIEKFLFYRHSRVVES